MAVEDKLDIKLNQNIWGLVVSYAALGAAEHWSLPGLRCLSIFIAGVFSISVVVCLMFYTYTYCVYKSVRAREIKADGTKTPK